MTAQTILDYARQYIGVTEKYNNNVLFNTEYYGHSVNGSNYAWCVVFIWYVFKMAGASKLFYGGSKQNNCTKLMTYYKNKKQFYASPKVGDIAFYNFSSGKTPTHVGIVSEVHPTYIKAIEGNTSTADQTNGGMVMERKRSRSVCLGYARPAYTEEVTTVVENKYASTATYKVGEYTLNDITYGDTGEAVKFLQQILNAAGYDCGDADGIAGAKTMKAIAEFQLAKRTTTCGHGTWNLLFDELGFSR